MGCWWSLPGLVEAFFGVLLVSLGGCDLGGSTLGTLGATGCPQGATSGQAIHGKASISGKIPGFGGFSATSGFSFGVPVADVEPMG